MHSVGRHAFWSVPASRSRGLRTEQIRLGGRYIGMSGGSIFMGQTPQSLDSLSIFALQNRILAAPVLERFQAELAELTNRPRGAFGGGGGPVQPPWDAILRFRPQLPALSPGDKALIRTISENPSSQDLDDLQVIDGFFGVVPGENQYRPEQALTPEVCDFMNGKHAGGGFGRAPQTMSAAQAIWTWMKWKTIGRGFGGRSSENVSDDELEAIRQNPFFCGTKAEFPEVVYGLDKSDYSRWFGIDPNQTWGAAKVHVQNAITVMNVVAAYPFPPPIDIEKDAAFWIFSIGEIREIVHTPTPVDPEVVRYWITMTVLANYSAWVDRIERDAKKKAKKAKRKMIMTVIGLALASIVAAILLPGVVALTVSAIKTAVTTYVDAQKRRKAAKDMADAAKMFEADAPGFSKEVDHAAQLLDEQAARDQAALAPDPELQAAIKEVEDDTGSGLLLPIGGGLAAAGLAAFLLLK